jgi:hypothetical protein
MPPVALVLATHLLVQQGVWRREARTVAAAGGRAGEAATRSSADAATEPAPELNQPKPEPGALGTAGLKLTGADLGRALGTSDSYGRLLLREFRTSHTAPDNGTTQET